MRGRGRREDGARVEIWIRPSGQVAAPSSQRGGSESSRDSEQDGELSNFSASEVRALLLPLAVLFLSSLYQFCMLLLLLLIQPYPLLFVVVVDLCFF